VLVLAVFREWFLLPAGLRAYATTPKLFLDEYSMLSEC
jgi:hypothetical protein